MYVKTEPPNKAQTTKQRHGCSGLALLLGGSPCTYRATSQTCTFVIHRGKLEASRSSAIARSTKRRGRDGFALRGKDPRTGIGSSGSRERNELPRTKPKWRRDSCAVTNSSRLPTSSNNCRNKAIHSPIAGLVSFGLPRTRGGTPLLYPYQY